MPDLDLSRLLIPSDIARCNAAHPADVGPPDPVEAYYLKLLRQAPELERRDGALFVNGIPRHVRSDRDQLPVAPARRWHTVAIAFDVATNILPPDPIERMPPWGQSREIWRRVCLFCSKVAEAPQPALFDYMLEPAAHRTLYFNIAADHYQEYVTFYIWAGLSEPLREALLDAIEARYPDDEFPVCHLDPCGLRPGWPRVPKQEQEEEAPHDVPLRSLWWWR
jgi:hypothetical protein